MSETQQASAKPADKKKIFRNDQYLGFAAYARAKSGNWKLIFNWKRIILILAALAVSGYLGIAYARYANDKYRKGLEETSYWTMLVYPFSREARIEHRKKLGDMYIAKAREAKTPGEVIQGIRTGLSLSPMNPDGRIYYSYLMFHQRMIKDAITLLAEGISAAIEHKEYVVYFLKRCLETAEDDTLIQTAETIIPQMEERIAEIDGLLAGTPSEAEKSALEERKKQLENNKMLLAVGAVQAAILRGRFEVAQKEMELYRLNETLTGHVLRAQILWESGEREKALAFLDEVAKKSGNNTQVVLLLAHYLVSQGESRRAMNVLLPAALAKENDNPEIQIRIISLFDPVKNKNIRDRRIDEYIRRYQENPNALFLLAQHATGDDDFALVERLYKIAENRVFENITRFEMVYIESLIANNRAKEALDMLEMLSKENTGWVEQNSAALNCLRTFAYYKNGDESLGRLALENILKNKTASVSQLILVGRRLTEMGLLDEGKSAYEAAYLSENYNHKALVALVDYAIEKKDVEVLLRYLPELLDSRRPPRRTLERIQRFLGSDRMIFVRERDTYLARIADLLSSKGASSDSDSTGQMIF